ncbi:sodium-coupled monocarboxylate transporter 2 isoform X2 [Denticeps clupeoides]|uniref:Sodium-coupled monocarboxylate transporter 2 n=1 Tax=Denticeps clupeoides TaxID=299321 RepID=A0AAY4CNV5_9TELE|nr:sodium-coupled monocarboxylate transporter 2 isoform X2 [Denticeps clupeoides]
MTSRDSAIRTFQVWDYAVFACLFVVSSAIGVFFAVKGRKQVSSKEFLVGGRQMTFGPVALSLTASFMSAVTVLGAPSEVYRFGASFILFGIAYSFVVIFTAQLFVPVFYRSGITSTYEYLELRFCKVVRVAATLIYIVQTILYTGVVVFAPALALNQVTGFDLWGSIYATGIVCTFYCTLGGLKAVVWSDAFQMVVMLVGFMTVLVQGSWSTGGVNNVWHTSQAGQRLEVFDFDPSPLRRHTFWTITVGGTFTWLGIYGVNQSTIQRCISCKSETHARLALYFNLLGLLVILLCSVFSGLIMYTFYAACDPWTAQYIKAPDQLMPYFVMEILGEYPGLPGLFVACAFSGTLSTVAASINALATVTYEDLVSQCCGNISNQAATLISKGLCVVYGVACTSMAIAASHMGGIVQAALSIHGMCGGPMLGLFSLGILFPCANSKGAAGGLILGIALSFWVGIGAFLYPASSNSTHPLGLSTEGCFLANATFNATVATPMPPSVLVEADSWYSISYLYYSAVGFLGTLVAGLVITCLTGCTPPEDIKPGLIQPVCDIFCFCSDKMKRECWCGVDHEEEKLELENPDFMLAEGRRCSQEISPSTMEKRQSIALQDKAYSNAGFVSDSQAF